MSIALGAFVSTSLSSKLARPLEGVHMRLPQFGLNFCFQIESVLRAP